MIINKYNQFLEGKSGKLYKYGCVMLYLNIKNWDSILDRINKSDVYNVNDPTKGYERHPHITIIFGLHSNVSDDDVLDVFKNLKSSDIDITVDGIGCFENNEYDVVKMNIISDKLNKLNNKLSMLDNTSDYSDYKPHITIAFVLPGTGKKYTQPEYKYQFDNFNKILYKKTNGQTITIPLS
jgi:2'-5' RNA ligase